jgi:light-regulated signal transduction histidine kinase (bacteriophytochrome)
MKTDRKNYDSEFCGSLPLQFINQIQNYGCLIVSDESGKILQVSENVESIFGLKVSELINNNISKFLGESISSSVIEKISNTPGKLPISFTYSGKNFNALAHFKEGLQIFEIEVSENTQLSFGEFFRSFKIVMNDLEGLRNLEALYDRILKHLKAQLGFDRIMIYQFDQDWNGTVIAEVHEPDMEPYLGLKFPASDVPKQARALYEKNAYRMIPDRSFAPVKLYPVINPVTNKFVDLSDCNLRSVAGVHLEYLKNMNVQASMSMRLMVNGKLWGLVSCHHKTPKKLSFEECSLFELLSSVVSNQISQIVNQRYFERINHLQEIKSKLIQHVIDNNDLLSGLTSDENNLMNLFNVEGVLVSKKNDIRSIGKVPDGTQVEELMMWLGSHKIDSLFYSDSYSLLNDDAANYKNLGSGIIVLPVNPDGDEYIIGFRPEELKNVHWGGNPNDAIQFESDGKKYHPRNSFHKWKETVKGASKPWLEEELTVAEQLRNFAIEFRFRSDNEK